MDSISLKPRYVLMALMAIALAFHSINLSTASYELDEAVHVWYAQMPFADVVEQASNDPNPPVYNLIISTWVKVFGVSEFSTRFFSVFMGVLGVGLMFLVAQRNFGMTVGILAALFYCFSPIQFRFTHLARPYSMLMVSVILSYGLLLECLRDSSKRKLVLYYLATTLMIYVHPTSIFNVAAQGLIILLHQWKNLKAVVRLALPLVGAVASFGVWMLAIPYFERDDAMWFSAPDWNAIYYVIKVFYGSTELVLLQLALLAIILVQAVKKGPPSSGLNVFTVLIWFMVPFCISIGFSHLIKPIFQDKYILSVQPAAMLFLAISIGQVRAKLLKWSGGLAAMSLFLLLISVQPKAEDDWKSAVEYVKPQMDENSMILIDPWYEFRTFAFYFDRQAYEEPENTLHSLYGKRVCVDWNTVFDTVSGQPKTDVVHFMLGHQGFVTPLVPTEVIDSLAFLTSQKEFQGVTVKSYSFSSGLDTVVSNRITFDDLPDQRELITEQIEFSQTMVIPLSVAQKRLLKITASVDVLSDLELEGAVLVVSLEKDGQSHVYETLQLKGDAAKTFTKRINVVDFNQDWVIKAYVWNTKGENFGIDNFKIVLVN